MITLSHKQEEVKQLLNLKYPSPKGWFTTKCPFCGKEGKFGVLFLSDKRMLAFNCFSGGCKKSGYAGVLLKHINRTDLLETNIDATAQIHNTLNKTSDTTEVIQVPQQDPPLGWTRIYQNQYLQDRGFEDWQFYRYKIGTTEVVSKLKNYVIFLIQQDGVNCGYVARITWNKQQLDKYKELTGRDKLRYINQEGIDFEKLLYGIDEYVPGETKRIIIVEGITDKANIDRVIVRLNLKTKIICVVSFGKKLSHSQITKLKSTNVQYITLMYDWDAVAANKKYITDLYLQFDSVSVALLINKDPGELTVEEFLIIMCNLYTQLSYLFNVVQRPKYER